MKLFIIHKVNIYFIYWYIIICDSFLHLKWKKNLNSSTKQTSHSKKKKSHLFNHMLYVESASTLYRIIYINQLFTHTLNLTCTQKRKSLWGGSEREKERDLHLFYSSHYCQELQKQISVKMTITEEHAAKQEASVTPPPSHQGNAWSSSRHFFRKPLKDQIDIQRARRTLKTKQNQLNCLWKARHNWQIEA